jgi:hypothetical protein
LSDVRSTVTGCLAILLILQQSYPSVCACQ